MQSNTTSAPAAARNAKAPNANLRNLPEWNLADLYPSMESKAFSDDLAKAQAECKSFAADYRGQIDALAHGAVAGSALAKAVQRYEALDDLIGRIMSYAGLVYAGDTTDPARAKFFGDAQE